MTLVPLVLLFVRSNGTATFPESKLDVSFFACSNHHDGVPVLDKHPGVLTI